MGFETGCRIMIVFSGSTETPSHTSRLKVKGKAVPPPPRRLQGGERV